MVSGWSVGFKEGLEMSACFALAYGMHMGSV